MRGDIGDSKSLLERMKKDGVEYVDLEFVDIFGTVKACEITSDKMGDVIEDGLWFDGSSIDGFAQISVSDMFLKPDLGTFTVLPSLGGKIARVVCDVYSENGKPFEGDPRYVLKRALKKAEERGLSYFVGPELEFFLFKNGDTEGLQTHDGAGYFDLGNRDMAAEVRRQVATDLQSMGLKIEMVHHEVAPGQHEIDFKYGDALHIADWVLAVKTTVKTVARRFNLHASFMPKPISNVNGSGMHVHQSLWRGGENAFYDEKDGYRFSSLAKSFVAGQLSHAKGLSGIVAPTVNSYKRLVPGFEAPSYICWGRTNRSALIRVPRYSEGKNNSVRCEFRAPDPSSNPYLVFACLLAAGMDGIERKLEPPQPIERNVYEFDSRELERLGIPTLPHSLRDAITELENDPLLKETLGKHVFEKLVEVQFKDWKDYKRSVSQWEIERYFKIL